MRGVYKNLAWPGGVPMLPFFGTRLPPLCVFCLFFVSALTSVLPNTHQALLGIAAIPGVESAALILMQTVPLETVQRIQNSLREMATFEGILEFQHQHFWIVHEGELAGSLHVRVRRDANSQTVLAQVSNKLAHLIAPRNLTVQVVKDDWMQAAIPVTPGYHSAPDRGEIEV
jgi:hypothetical protein